MRRPRLGGGEALKRSTRSLAGSASAAVPGMRPLCWARTFLFRVESVELCKAELSPGKFLLRVEDPVVPDIPGLVNLLVSPTVVDAAGAANLLGRLTLGPGIVV